jgi:hypothetical protein
VSAAALAPLIDADGNHLVTETASSLVWDYRDRVAQAAGARAGESVYERDAMDRLVREVTTTQAAHVETIHLDHLQVTRLRSAAEHPIVTSRPYVTDGGETLAELVAPEGVSSPAIRYALADPERSVGLRLDAAAAMRLSIELAFLRPSHPP